MMERRAVVVGLAASLIAGSALAAPTKAPAPTAAAATTSVSGKILRVDPANQTVTLTDGQYYMVPAAIKLDGFKTGDQVTMSVEKDQYGIFTVKTIAEAGAKKG
jgi:Cu/Ag efflux protein CusF